MGGVARGVIRSLPYLYREVNYSKSLLIDSVLRNVGVYSVKKNYKSVNFCGICLSVFYVEVTNQNPPMKKYKRNHLFI